MNKTTKVPCPDYIPDFDPTRFIERTCFSDIDDQPQWQILNVTDIFSQGFSIYNIADLTSSMLNDFKTICKDSAFQLMSLPEMKHFTEHSTSKA